MEKEILFKKEIKKYEVQFFKNYNDIGDKPSRKIRRAGTFNHSHFSNVETDFEKHFADKLTSVSRVLRLFVVEKTEEKLSLKTFILEKWRTAGNHFFQDKKRVLFVTFNLKTKDVYQGGIENYHRKVRSTKSIRKNYFNNISFMKLNFENLFYQFGSEFKNHHMEDVIDIVANNLGYAQGTDIQTIFEDMAINYYRQKGVKLPNNINVFLNNSNNTSQEIPKLKTFRKFKNKFVDAYMYHNGLYGKEIKKILHETTGFSNIHGYKSMVDLFGYDIIYKNKAIGKILEGNSSSNYWGIFPENLSKKQTETLFKYFMWMYDGLINSNTLSDHIRYYLFLTDKGEKLDFTSKTIDEFINEHSNWSVFVSSYQRGIIIRQYPMNFEEKITETITDFIGNEYYPVLLKTTPEYENESVIQTNCVRTYIESSHSVILSVRLGNIDSKERATIEYSMKLNDKTNKIEPKRIQSLGRFNKVLTEGWTPILEILDKRVLELVNNDFKIGLKISYRNGKTYKKESVISEKHNTLIWGGEESVTSNFIDLLEINLFPE
jgi:hypothetical protein